MSDLKVPIICTVIGEGGSGGALAIGVGDATLMLEYSTYSVISPEGCASILWRSADHAETAAEALSITSKKLKSLKLIDTIIKEPLGSAHKDIEQVATTLGDIIEAELNRLKQIDMSSLVKKRYERFMGYGVFQESNS
jgi:acetyl-CoA carboxylase carboxyl transferase subunit alpha